MIRQMEYSNTQASAAKVSLLTIGQQANPNNNIRLNHSNHAIHTYTQPTFSGGARCIFVPPAPDCGNFRRGTLQHICHGRILQVSVKGLLFDARLKVIVSCPTAVFHLRQFSMNVVSRQFLMLFHSTNFFMPFFMPFSSDAPWLQLMPRVDALLVCVYLLTQVRNFLNIRDAIPPDHLESPETIGLQ